MHTNCYYRIKELFTKTGAEWDKLAPKEEEAIAFAHRYINPEPKRMIDREHYSLEYCLAHSGEIINNRYRRGNDDCKDDIDKQIPGMVAQYTTQIPLVLYRGVCDHVYELMIKNAEGIEGTDLLEKGFLATSLVKGHEINYPTKLRIYVPAGTHAVYQGNVNDEQNFYEVDIQHEAHLKIISKDDKYINCVLSKTA